MIQEDIDRLNKLQREVAIKRKELLTMIRKNRGYKDPNERMIEGKTFIMPESTDFLRILSE